jgi:hypothetical protein
MNNKGFGAPAIPVITKLGRLEQVAEKLSILSFREKRGISPRFKPEKGRRDSSLLSE